MTKPRNATTTTKGRTYKWRDEQFDSVTTIINGGVPKPALTNWAAKRVAEIAVEKSGIWSQMQSAEAVDWLKRAPYRESEAAAAKGSDIHAWAEAYILGEPVVVERMPADHQGYGKAFLSFIAELKPTWEMAEASVYNREYHYAGTCDALMRVPTLGDGLGLVDYKTGRTGIYPEVALQLSAYANAEFVGLPDGTEQPMPKIDWCAALWLKPTGYELIPVDAGPLAFEYFLAAQIVRDFQVEVGKQMLFPSVTLPGYDPRPTAPPNVLALTE